MLFSKHFFIFPFIFVRKATHRYAIMEETLLLSRLADGEEDAFEELFTRYYSPLCEYASQYIRDEEAEELVQDLMLFLWETREELMIDTSLSSYLFTAVRHRCLNAIRKKLYHEQVHSKLYERFKEQFEDPNYYLANELSQHIRQAIEELPESYRQTFSLSRFGQKTNVEIATSLGVSVKTVEYRISQSLKILRLKLKDFLLVLFHLLMPL